MQLAEQSILTSLKASGRLPSPTGVALQILELTRDPNTGTEDMADVLRGDPALAGQLLKFANSADAGSRTEIRSLNEALVRLGTSTVRQLCLGFSVVSNARQGPCVGFDYQRYWTHALAQAVSCQALARRIPSISPDGAFTCGLLASIGKLALASVYPDEFAAILEAWNDGSAADLVRQERVQLSIDHNQVTAALFEDWRLPDRYRHAVSHQDDGDLFDALGHVGNRDRDATLTALLSVADLAARICVESGPRRHLLVMDFVLIGCKLGIPEAAWSTMYDEILAEWARVGRVLDIVTSRVSSLDELVRRAREHRTPILEAAPTEASEAETDALDILAVVYDEEELAALRVQLATGGHRVTVARDGRQALECALQRLPQLVLTDVHVPGLDGLELCRTLRRSEQTRRTYVVAMTRRDDADEQITAFAAGVNDTVARPIDHRLLAARLRAAAFVIRLQEQADRDQTQLQRTLAEWGKLTRRLEHMALEDQLTGLPNRRSGLQQLDKEWARTGREDTGLMVMIGDIDHFKCVNDEHGHDAGDLVLRETAHVLQRTMRKSDTVCRFGGEEFLVICPGADLAVALELGDRLRAAVEHNQIDTPEFCSSVTVSIGVAARGSRHASPKDLIREADEALYAAKDAGRNKVCITADE